MPRTRTFTEFTPEGILSQMERRLTTAEQILAYIEKHGKATRPELERVFGLYEKTVDSAIRKLVRLGFIKRAGKTPKIPRQKRSVIFALTGLEIDLSLVGDCRGRPRISAESKPVESALNFGELTQAMNAFFKTEAA
jgi:hypothetical protein